MARAGLGFRTTLVVHLLIVLTLGAGLLGYASLRLAKYQLFVRELHSAKVISAWMIEEAQALAGADRDNLRLIDLQGRGQALIGSLRSLLLTDERHSVMESTDSRWQSGVPFDPLGLRGHLVSHSQDWWLWEEDGQRLLVVSRTVSASRATLWAFHSLLELDLAGQEMEYQILLYGLLAVGLTSLAGFALFSRLIVRPLEQVLALTSRVPAGDWNLLVEAERHSEFGRLGIALSQMARRIATDQETLKEKIRELERLNRDLHQAQLGLVRSEKLASVGRLAAGLAHEVGNPLAAILGFVGILRSEPVPEADRGEILARVEKEVERVDGIIRNLLSYSRPGTGAITSVDLAGLVREAVSLLATQKKWRQVFAESFFGPGLPAVQTDFELIRQVLVNLLWNALDAVQEGGHIWVRVAAVTRGLDGGLWWDGRPEDPGYFALGELHRLRLPRNGKDLVTGRTWAILAVIDDGDGIPEENLVRVFDPFFTTKAPGKGTGLGLAICHSVVSALGGEIWVYSKVGLGTQFAFSLPVTLEAGKQPAPETAC